MLVESLVIRKSRFYSFADHKLIFGHTIGMTKDNNNCEFSIALTQLMPRLYRYALVLTQNAPDAEDLLQASLARALEKQHQWRVGSELDRWVFTIQSSVWKNKQRARYKRNAIADQSADSLIDSNLRNDPQRTFLLQQVLTEVMKLSEIQRIPMLLVYVEGFSYQETADMLDIPIGTVMSRLARARTRLAAHFKAETVEPKLDTPLKVQNHE